MGEVRVDGKRVSLGMLGFRSKFFGFKESSNIYIYERYLGDFC